MGVPDGFAVERLAISMAAAVGVSWPTADMDTVTHYRMCANAALVHWSALGRAQTDALPTHLAKGLENAAGAADKAASLMATWTGDNALEDRLFKAAAYIRQVGRVLEVLAPEEQAAEGPDPGDVI